MGSWRRFLILLITSLVAVGTVGAAGWFVWVPSYRPSLQGDEALAVSVSQEQGAVDWQAALRDGISAAYLKATEGADHVDSAFGTNWAAARSAGVRVGAYHFFTLCGGKQQAANLIRTAPAAKDALPPAVDLELVGNCADRPDRRKVQSELQAFLAGIEAHYGRRAVLYVGPEFERAYPIGRTLGRALWYTRFMRRPGRVDWAIWGVGGLARVGGISGRVDLNVIRLSAFVDTVP